MANNIILQTIKDVEFFNTRVYLEIFAKERQAYLILSKQKPFDIDSLKEYLIENNLNQFAKKEIIRLIEVIDYFADLNTKYKEIPISNNFYHYKNDNNGGKTECSGWGNLFYILNTNDRFIKTNEDNFKEKHKSNLIFTFLTASRISTKLNEIKNLFTEYLEPIIFTPEPTKQPEAVNPDEVKKEFKDFFNSDVNVNVIQSIQKEFKDYKGKKMAHLIYLLHKDFNIITYGINSRTESRKHFVSLLKGTDFRMAGIDKYFELSDVKLLNPKFESDPDYIDIKEKLLKTIK